MSCHKIKLQQSKCHQIYECLVIFIFYSFFTYLHTYFIPLNFDLCIIALFLFSETQINLSLSIQSNREIIINLFSDKQSKVYTSIETLTSGSWWGTTKTGSGMTTRLSISLVGIAPEAPGLLSAPRPTLEDLCMCYISTGYVSCNQVIINNRSSISVALKMAEKLIYFAPWLMTSLVLSE